MTLILTGSKLWFMAGKGDKDRVTMLPDKLKLELQRHLKRVRLLWESDIREGFGEVYLPEGLARKYPNAAREWGWQWVFPSRSFGGSRIVTHPPSPPSSERRGGRRARVARHLAAASCAGDGFAAGGEGGSAADRDYEGGELSYVAAFVCDASFGEWL